MADADKWQRIINSIPGVQLEKLEGGVPGFFKATIRIDESRRKAASDAAYEVLMTLDGKRVFQKRLDRTDMRPCYESAKEIRAELDKAIKKAGPTSPIHHDLTEMSNWCVQFVDAMEKYPQYLEEGLSNAPPDDILDFNTELGQMRGAIAQIARRLCDEYGHTLSRQLAWAMTDRSG